jgi:hypothetical protein
MIPESYSHSYQKFRQLLEQFKADCCEPNSRGSLVQSRFQSIQQEFQAILDRGLGELDPAQVANIQAYYTEINKQLRLLSMDVIFLQASRQSTTSQQRQRQMGDRIERLLQYCEALLEV